MSQSFSYEMHLDDSPVKAQARVRRAVTEQMANLAGMTPVGDPAKAMKFAPKLAWPVLVAVGRRATGERVTVEFRDADHGTDVAVSGRVSGEAKIIATQEFWTKALLPSAG